MEEKLVLSKVGWMESQLAVLKAKKMAVKRAAQKAAKRA